ncbi:MAG TPA: PEP/pyruvate-binding domain-containing protein, partial [Geobacteraceae bacterium]
VSYNTFVWHRDLDPRGGMLRLVVGLGTRAVDRTEGDYARLVALDRPELSPHGGAEDLRRFCQREADLLNLEENSIESLPLARLVGEGVALPLDLLAEVDREGRGRLAERGRRGEDSWLFTFAGLLSTDVTAVMGRMLKTLEMSYDYPVDVEFTVNFDREGGYAINIVQCRPLQTRGVGGGQVAIPSALPDGQVLFRSRESFMGGNVVRPIRRVIAIDAPAYSELDLSGKYEVARLVGRLNRLVDGRDALPTLLIGPGRWGTSTPSLGVPVRFAEIANAVAIVEVAFPIGGLLPDLSFGSHFFQDMVEADIFYAALFPGRSTTFFNNDLLSRATNQLTVLLPEEERYEGVVRVVDFTEQSLELRADIISQETLCFLPAP